MKLKIIMLIGLPVAGALAAATVFAQSDPIAERKALMKQNNNHAREMVRMIRGQAPYDAAKVEAGFAQWIETAKKLPGLFPENSKSGGDTRATAKVWQTKADFDAKAAAFGKAAEENRAKSTASLEGLKTGLSAVGATCDSCHEDYRASR